jgi:hypothetical protein
VSIYGVNIIFIAPPVLLVLLAMIVGAWRLSRRGPKAALVSLVRIFVYGGFALFILFFLMIGSYYATGGH